MASSLAQAGVGFLKNVLAASYFGTSGTMDAYLLGLLLPDMVMFLATTGTFTFVPLFAEARARSEAEGWATASKLITFWLFLLFTGLCLAAFFTPELTGLLAPGFQGDQREHTVEMTRILLLMSGAVASARVMALVLYSKREFLAPEASETLFQVSSTLYLIVFRSHGISALVWGMVFGSFVQLLVVSVGLRDRKGQLHLSLDLRAPAVRKMMKLVFPVYVSSSAGQLNQVVNRAFASLLPAGAISSLQYGVMLAEAPVTVFASSLSGALFPFLSKQFADKEDRQAQDNLGRAIVGILLVFLPVATGVFLIARPVVQVLLQRGSFDAHSTDLTCGALRIYALGILAMALNRVLPAAYQARQNTTVPMQAGLLRIAGNVVVCALLVPRIGHLGVATAAVVAEHLKLGLLFLRLRTTLFREKGRMLLGAMARLVPAVTIMAAAVLVAGRYLSQDDAHWGLRGFISLLTVILVGGVSYATSVVLLCREQVRYYSRRLLRELPPPFGRLGGSVPSGSD